MADSDKLLDLIARTNAVTPNDTINYGPAAAANPALSQPVLDAIQQSGPAAPRQILVVPDSATAERDASFQAPLSFDEQNAGEAYGGGSLQGNNRLAAQSRDLALRREKMGVEQQHQSFQEQLGLANLALSKQAEERNAAVAHYDVISKHQKIQDEAKSHADSSDFIRELNKITHDDPDLVPKVGGLFAKFSRADKPAVTEALKLKMDANKRHQDGLASGGAHEFNLPGQDEYTRVLTDTGGDVYQAKAAGKLRHEEHKQFEKDRSEGLLTNEDMKIAQDGGILTPDGKAIDYPKARLLATGRQGEATGKPVTAAAREAQYSEKFIENAAKNPDIISSSEGKALLQFHVKRAHDFAVKQTGTEIKPPRAAADFVP